MLKAEQAAKEKLGKEKDGQQSELLSLKERLRDANSVADDANRKLANAESQLLDLTSQGLDTTDVGGQFYLGRNSYHCSNTVNAANLYCFEKFPKI